MSHMLRVGVFVTIALMILGYFILKIEDLQLFQDDGERVVAGFASVAGLDDKAAVRVAGVRVGRVDGIDLEADRALVTLLLERPVDLRVGASARIANLGLLGDKYVELDIGPGDAPLLPAGEILPGTTPLGWDQAMARIDGIGQSIQATLGALDPEESGATFKRLLISLEATVESVRRMIDANEARVGGTIANMERFSATLAEDLPRLTAQMQQMLELVDSVVAENRGAVKDGLSEFSETAAALRASMENLEEISTKLVAGEGTIGKLLTSDEAHNELVATLDGVKTGVGELSDTLTRIKRLGLDLAIDGYYLSEFEDSRSSVSMTLTPSTDRFYRLAIVDDPRGRTRTRTEIETVTGPDGLTETTTTRTVRTDDETTVSAQVGFRLGSASFRAGLFESSGGAAVDYDLFDDRFALSLEAFDFGRENDLDPHLRVTGKWRVHPNVYLLGGYDDFLVSSSESVFLGAGITWSDEDLKYLLGSLPRP
jgi:phospholipid/cholesterol/gamma-HCH transport system substrate-binding protein